MLELSLLRTFATGSKISLYGPENGEPTNWAANARLFFRTF